MPFLPKRRLQNDLYCVEWDVKLYYTVPATTNDSNGYQWS